MDIPPGAIEAAAQTLGIAIASRGGLKLLKAAFRELYGHIKPLTTSYVDAKAENIKNHEKIKGEFADKTLRLKLDQQFSLEERAYISSQNQQIREQVNVEKMISSATTYMPDEVNDEEPDLDVISQIFDGAKKVTDEYVLDLWGKVFAGETATPGSYSLRTISFLKTMSKKDSELFTTLGNYVWRSTTSDEECFLIHNEETKKYLTTQNLGLTEIKHLESIGLIITGLNFNLGNDLLGTPDDPVSLSYGKDAYLFKKKSDAEFSFLPTYKLTTIGMELLKLCEPTIDQTYLSILIESLEKENVISEYLK